MKNQTMFFAIVCAICILFYRCNNSSSATTAVNDSSDASNTNTFAGYASQADWGRHLVTVCGCGDCHTPKKMTPQGPADDTSLLLSGHPSQLPPPVITAQQISSGLAATNDLTAWIGAWGKSYAANITPDSTGIRTWTEDQFITCIRKGLYKGIEGSRPLMPPMPVNSYRNLTDAELKAIFAFLKTINPIHNTVSEYQPPAGAAKQ